MSEPTTTYDYTTYWDTDPDSFAFELGEFTQEGWRVVGFSTMLVGTVTRYTALLEREDLS